MNIIESVKSLFKSSQSVEKTIADLNYSLESLPALTGDRRGLNIFSLSQLMAVTGIAKDGARITGYYDQSVFYLTHDERLSIYRLCDAVNAVVTSRMNFISAMDFDIVSAKKEEDKIQYELKNIKAVYDEYSRSGSTPHIIASTILLQKIKDSLPDVLPDLSNFDKSLLRWHKRIQAQNTEQGNWIKEWLLRPNIQDKFEDLIKKMVFDLMIHGATCLYKEMLSGKVENFYPLPGGTVMPLRNKYVGGISAYVQMTNNVEQPQIFYEDEVSYANYLPTTARSYGMIPLECLINKISESLQFDYLMAMQADGTRPPEKMVIVSNASPFAGLNQEGGVLPIPESEQKRLETKLNTPRKNSIMTFTGNNATVVDLSKENTMEFQHTRQADIRNVVGMVFQATSMEMNLAGGEDTSGRSTADAQREQYHSRGVLPICRIIEQMINRDILPYRFGSGWKFDYKTEKNEIEEMELIKAKMDTGVFSVNEVRKKDLNEDPFDDPTFDKPLGAPAPDGSSAAPFNMKGL